MFHSKKNSNCHLKTFTGMKINNNTQKFSVTRAAQTHQVGREFETPALGGDGLHLK